MNANRAVLRVPLRDVQQCPPQWHCFRCGQEQYPFDRRYERAGRGVCEDCLARLGRKEQEQYHEIV